MSGDDMSQAVAAKIGSNCYACKRWCPNESRLCGCGATPPHRWLENLAAHLGGFRGDDKAQRPKAQRR